MGTDELLTSVPNFRISLTLSYSLLFSLFRSLSLFFARSKSLEVKMGTDDSPHVCTRFSPAPASIPSSPGSHSNSTQIIPKNGVCPYFYFSAFLVRAALSPRSGHCVPACSSPALRLVFFARPKPHNPRPSSYHDDDVIIVLDMDHLKI